MMQNSPWACQCVQHKEHEFWNSTWLESCLSDLWLGELPPTSLSFPTHKMEKQLSLYCLTVRRIQWSNQCKALVSTPGILEALTSYYLYLHKLLLCPLLFISCHILSITPAWPNQTTTVPHTFLVLGASFPPYTLLWQPRIPSGLHLPSSLVLPFKPQLKCPSTRQSPWLIDL